MRKKIWMILVCIISMSFCMAGCTGNTSKKKSNGKIRITTSFYTMYDFAKKIGGDKVEVINLVPAGTEPHDWEPSTKDLIEMEKSDIFIYNGAGMEQWVDDVLESLDTEELTSVEASKGIKLLKDQDAHEHDHEHNSENDPHVWLDPQNAKYEMNKIKKALIKADPVKNVASKSRCSPVENVRIIIISSNGFTEITSMSFLFSLAYTIPFNTNIGYLHSLLQRGDLIKMLTSDSFVPGSIGLFFVNNSRS